MQLLLSLVCSLISMKIISEYSFQTHSTAALKIFRLDKVQYTKSKLGVSTQANEKYRPLPMNVLSTTKHFDFMIHH